MTGTPIQTRRVILFASKRCRRKRNTENDIDPAALHYKNMNDQQFKLQKKTGLQQRIAESFHDDTHISKGMPESIAQWGDKYIEYLKEKNEA